MTATNHALTGALIGLTLGNPWVALPAALASHFVCDAIPHFGNDRHDPINTIWFRYFLGVDMSLCVGLVALLAITQPTHWLLASITAFAATSPDLLSLRRFVGVVKGQGDHPSRLLIQRFHSRIQWFQRPLGGAVELAWLSGAVLLLTTFLG